MTLLSCSHLEKLGWKRKGMTWEKGYDTITFDGTDFKYFLFPDCVKSLEGGGVKIESVKIRYTQELKR